MLLAIDVGNTQITIGLYDGGTLGARWRLATDQERLPDEYGILLINLFQHAKVGPGEIDGIALASVVPPLTATFEQACREYLGRAPLVVGTGTRRRRRCCSQAVRRSGLYRRFRHRNDLRRHLG